MAFRSKSSTKMATTTTTRWTLMAATSFLLLAIRNTVHAAITCPRPGKGPGSPLTPGTTVTIHVAPMDQLCTLVRLTKTTTNIFSAPVGRSYNNKSWESVQGPYTSDIKFDCTESGSTRSNRASCTTTLPMLDDPTNEEFVLISYSHKISDQEEIARFLEQTTFGPKRSEFSEFKYDNNNNPDFAGWVKHQMNVRKGGITSHREYFRTRANARVTDLDDETIANGDRPCDIHSRWKRYAFSYEDGRDSFKEIDFYFTIYKATNDVEGKWFMIKNVKNQIITEVPSSTWGTYFEGIGERFTVCDNTLGEWTKGTLAVQLIDNDKDNNCYGISSGNPMIQFRHVTTPEHVLELPDDNILQEIDTRESKGSDFLLTKPILNDDVCKKLPREGGDMVHAVSKDRQTWYVHDPRIVLKLNTVESPLMDGGGTDSYQRNTTCSNVPRTFLNEEGCRLSMEYSACTPSSHETDFQIPLSEATLKELYKRTRQYIYALEMTEPQSGPCTLFDSDKIDYTKLPRRSRWKKLPDLTTPEMCPTMDGVSETTKKFLHDLIRKDFDPHPTLKDIEFLKVDADRYCDATDEHKGMKLWVDDTCWEHVHNDHLNVYDFTDYAVIHGRQTKTDTGTFPITKFADQEKVFLKYPEDHHVNWWKYQKDNDRIPNPIGRFGDFILIDHIPKEMRTESVIQMFEESGYGKGRIVCGSPNEVANNPLLGHEFDIAMNATLDRTLTDLEDYEAQKWSVWNTIALYSNDQLRQRMAFALSQIFAMVPGDIDQAHETESFLNYYDIFVRHAFGKYEDILKEVAYHPMMAEMLTYLESKSSGYAYETKKLSNVYPDENFAREIMQLFSIGLVKLNMDGTPVIRKEDGTVVQTYSNLNIMDNSRAWTGFDRQDLAGRANIELLTPIRNRIDPMKINPDWRDPMPKASLYHEGYIGDSDVPLCMDLPPSIFLKKGATYRLLGSNKMPDLIEDPKWWNMVNEAERLIVQQGTSSLYEALCSDTNGDGVCEYPITVTLPKTIPCDEHECMIDEPRVVQVGTSSSSNMKIYYEYVRPPCVQFPFYNNALKMKKKLEIDQAMCADPRMAVASEACCDDDSGDELTGFFEHTKKNCMFPGEKVTYDTAVKRCEDKGWKPCSTRMSIVTNDKYCSGPYNCCIYNEQYHWTNIDCQISIKINPRGEIAVIHSHADRDVVTGKMRGDIHESVKEDNVNFFRVHWRHGSFPSASDEGDIMCNGSCKMDPTNTDICLCDISVMESQVFETLPTAERALDMLKIGGVPPKWYNRGECKILEQSSDVKAWDCTKSGKIDEDTVFEVKRGYYPKYYLKNTHSSVRVNEGAYEFRNPPHFMTLSERNVRDAQYETDAVLRQVIYHPNTPPFMARRIIQRFGISNPSPGYIEAVATAFLSGRFSSGGKTFGSGDYGDLGATCAATLLHDEARSVVLDADPSYGNLREPLLRVMHVMRSLEIVPNEDLYPHIKTISMDKKIGQMAHSIPNVFSFFLPDYIPPGRANAASIYSPEAGVASTPNIIGIMGGLFSLVKYGLSSCDSGFGPKAASCGVGAGQLSYQSPIANDLDAAIEELSLLLTAGRLTTNAKNLIKLTALDGYNFDEQVRIVQQLIMTTPEFHASGVVERTPELRPEPEPPVYSGKGYKNVVFLFLEAGFDSFNFMVPDNEKCASMYDMYKNTRGPLALDPEKELTEAYSAAGSQSVCDSWKFHVNATSIAKLFGEQDAIVFSNIGVLLEAGVNKENWESLHRDTVLFAHDKQQDEAKSVDPFHDVSGTGVIGRITDALTTSSNPFKTNSISFGGVKALAGEDGVSPTIKHVNEDGATQFDPRPSTKDVLPTVKKLNNFTTYDSNVFGDFWSNRVVQSLTENHEFHTLLGKTTVTKKFTTTLTPRKFEVIAKLIKGHEERGIDRDFFYLSKPGWDVHGAEAKLKTATLLEDVDESLKEFVEELKHQDKWKDTVIVCLSEFGRTLTANSGGGSDHAWGGQAFIAGGSVKGGRILGKYPENYDDYDVSRGRLYPAIPFDSMWNGIATWMGVPGPMMNKVLPNRHKFRDDLYGKNDLFI